MGGGRNTSIDIAKGLGMLLVIAGHAIYGYGAIFRIIYSFHMPLFFFLSGLFLKKEIGILLLISKLTKSLLLPLVIWLPILYLTYYIRGVYISFVHLPETTWFLPVLFCSEILAYLILKAKCSIVKYCVIATFGLSVNIVSLFILLPNAIISILFAASLISIASEFKHAMSFKLKTPFFVLILLMFVLCGSCSTTLLWKSYMTPFGISLVAATLGIILTIDVSNKIASSQYKKIKNSLAYIGRNTLIIMLIHPTILTITSSICRNVYDEPIVYKILEFALCVILSLLTTELIKIVQKYGKVLFRNAGLQ